MKRNGNDLSRPLPSKSVVRKQALALRDSMSVDERQQKSNMISEILVQTAVGRSDALFGADGSPRHVAVYLPWRSEADIMPFIRWCWREGWSVWAPRIRTDRKLLEFCHISGDGDWTEGAFGIREPASHTERWDNETDWTLMAVPGVAFSLQGERLGYGGGYYDRYLEQRDAGKRRQNPWRVGVCFDVQLTDNLPAEPHDIRMDALVTESGLHTVKFT